MAMLIADQKYVKELTGILREPKDCACLMLKTPLKLTKKNYKTVWLFILLILITYLLMLIFVFPSKNIIYISFYYIVLSSAKWFYVDTIAFGFSILFYVMSSAKDPGFLQKP